MHPCETLGQVYRRARGDGCSASRQPRPARIAGKPCDADRRINAPARSVGPG